MIFNKVSTQNSISDNINNKLVNVTIAKIRNIMKLCQMIFNKVPTQNSISDNINNRLVNVTISKIRNIMKHLSDYIQQGANTKLYK